MALFTSADAPRPRPAANPVEQHTVVRAGTALDGALRAGALVIEDGAVFSGRCEMGAGRAAEDVAASSAAHLIDGLTLTGIAATA